MEHFYTIKFQNDKKIFRIIPEYENCFDYPSFYKEIKPNKDIELGIDNSSNILKTKSIFSVVSIRVENKEYLNLNCINKSIKNNKITIPLIIFIGLIFIFLLIYIQKRMGIKI